ncbi:MAG: hypothetical protein RIQ53_1717 [Pseudomonadota bacterium]|jgi:uncharacterized iron-regulated membrane protein
MKSEHLRIYKTVHTWTGIVCGMALFIAFYAGALTVFKQPLQRWASSAVVQPTLPLEAVQPLIVRTLAAAPEARRDFTVWLHDDALTGARAAQAWLGWQVHDEAADEHDSAAVRHRTATLDAAGAVQVQALPPSQVSPLADVIDTLHRVLGLPTDSDPHRWIMGVVSALYALALFSGVVVLLPTLVKDLFALRVGPNLKRMWLDAHNVVGLFSLPFHLVMALTAVVFAFHDPIYGLQDDLIHQGRWASAFARGGAPARATAPRDPAALLPPARLLALARQQAPGLAPEALQYLAVTTPRAAVRVWGRDPAAVSPRARGGFLALDPYSGRVLSTDFLPGRQTPANQWIASFFALHMAAFGGTEVAWLYFVLALAGAWLFYSGNLLWVESRRKRAPRGQGTAVGQRRDVRLMAAATVGVCLGCVCGISLMLAATRGLHGRVADPLAWHHALYYGAFFGALAWAFWRGAARAAVELLWAAAALTAAIPLGSWAAPALWGGRSPAEGGEVWGGVELTAWVGALVLAGLARAATRRARTGPADSVWSWRTEPVLRPAAMSPATPPAMPPAAIAAAPSRALAAGSPAER